MADLTAGAVALLNQGDVDGARALFQFALEQQTALFGPDSPVLADDLSNLGNVLADQDDPATARPLLERALLLHEWQYGLDDPEVATDLGNLCLSWTPSAMSTLPGR